MYITIITQIKQFQDWSNIAWNRAIDIANEKSEAMKELAKSCDDAYNSAIDSLEGQYADWAFHAKESLLEAKSLEDEIGESFHADWALEALDEEEALDEYLEEDSD